MASTTEPKLNETLSCFASLLASTLTANGEMVAPATLLSLQRFLSPSPNDEELFKFPGLSLQSKRPNSLNHRVSPEENATLKLSVPKTCRRSEISKVPTLMARNLSLSLMMLVESRLRSSTLALLKQTTDAGRGQSTYTKILTSLLSSGDAILWSATVTSFQVLPMGGRNVSDGLVLPLVFDVVIDLIALHTTVPVSLKAPGTITGNLSKCGSGLEFVELSIDAGSLLRAMMKQARFVIRKTVALATALSGTVISGQNPKTSLSSNSLQNIASVNSKNGMNEIQKLSNTKNGSFSTDNIRNLAHLQKGSSSTNTIFDLKIKNQSAGSVKNGDSSVNKLQNSIEIKNGNTKIGSSLTPTNSEKYKMPTIKRSSSTMSTMSSISARGKTNNQFGMMPPPPPRKSSRHRLGLEESKQPTTRSNATFDVPMKLNSTLLKLRKDPMESSESDDKCEMPSGSVTSESPKEDKNEKRKYLSLSNQTQKESHHLPHKKRRILSCPNFMG